MMTTIPDKLDSESRIASLLWRLRIDTLIPFHQKLLDRLRANQKMMKEGQGANVADVFIELKVKRLMRDLAGQVFCCSLGN